MTKMKTQLYMIFFSIELSKMGVIYWFAKGLDLEAKVKSKMYETY